MKEDDRKRERKKCNSQQKKKQTRGKEEKQKESKLRGTFSGNADWSTAHSINHDLYM